MQDRITSDKLDKYFDVTKRALLEAQSAIDASRKKDALDFLDMSETQQVSEHAQKPHKHKKECTCRYCLSLVIFDMSSRYYSDAQHFKSKGDIVTAFAALNYAHGWLDAGARIGLFKVHNNELFTVD